MEGETVTYRFTSPGSMGTLTEDFQSGPDVPIEFSISITVPVEQAHKVAYNAKNVIYGAMNDSHNILGLPPRPNGVELEEIRSGAKEPGESS